MRFPVLLLSSSVKERREREGSKGDAAAAVQVKCYNSVHGHYGWCGTDGGGGGGGGKEEEGDNLPHDKGWGWCTKSCTHQ